MKYYLPLFTCCLLLVTLNAQNPERYSSVRISLAGKTIAELVQTGIETEHGQYYPGRSITTVLSSQEIDRVQKAGFQTEILIADLKKYYLEQRDRPAPVHARGGNCDQSTTGNADYVTPANYSYGTMGGYLTYAQMMAELDKMRSLYPNLISTRQVTSDTILTWDGHPIYHVKISDNPDVDEPEREVLYTALHHAREPNSASQLIFFMWYLLENYATRPDIQAIVNNLEMYFVPCINVDGYLFNELTDPDGGGFWRKNRRDNEDGTYGIDLNRNYGYFWGDFGGSSPDPSSEIYRGPEAFSEPETRTMRDFCRVHDFLFVLNYHTSGNLFIYPWAYSDSPADSSFVKYARFFTRENHYHYGTTTETVGYNVNGSSDDWMYAERGSYSFTPEIGTTGFWPLPSEIDDLNKDNLLQNFSVAYSALRYGVALDQSDANLSVQSGNIPVELTRYGLVDGPVTVSLVPFSSNISSGISVHAYNIANLSKETQQFSYQLNPAIQNGDEVVFLLQTDNGYWVKTDTLKKIYNAAIQNSTITPFTDHLNNINNWNTDWDLTTESFHSAPTSMTDSPNGNYPPDVTALCGMVPVVAIPANAESANLRFFAKWDLEEDWDFTLVAGFGNGGPGVPLCGLYTEQGTNIQPAAPLYDGQQAEWVEECMSLNDFIGQQVQIEFQLISDGFQEGDGFYFDDVRIEYTLPVSGTHSIGVTDFSLSQNEPNPFYGSTRIRWDNGLQLLGDQAMLVIFNVLGKVVFTQPVNLLTQNNLLVDAANLAPGVYSYQIRNERGQSRMMKMSVAR